MTANHNILWAESGLNNGNIPYGALVTWDPANKGTGVALTGANLIATITETGGDAYAVKATAIMPTGTSVFEVTIGAFVGSSPDAAVGMANSTFAVNHANMGGNTNNNCYDSATGHVYLNGSSQGNVITWTTGDIIGVKNDTVAGKVSFFKNGVITGIAYSNGLGNSLYACVSLGGTGNESGVFTVNFGATTFAYTY